MWDMLRRSPRIDPDFEDFSSELMQGTSRTLILTIGIPCLIVCYLAVV